MTSTIERQIKCVAREIAMRKSVYPKFVSSKRMKPHQAEEEIAVMEDVLKTLQIIADNLSADCGIRLNFTRPCKLLMKLVTWKEVDLRKETENERSS